MTRLLAYLLISGITLGVSLSAVNSTNQMIKVLNQRQTAQCDSLNAVTPGSCVMP